MIKAGDTVNVFLAANIDVPMQGDILAIEPYGIQVHIHNKQEDETFIFPWRVIALIQLCVHGEVK